MLRWRFVIESKYKKPHRRTTKLLWSQINLRTTWSVPNMLGVAGQKFDKVSYMTWQIYNHLGGSSRNWPVGIPYWFPTLKNVFGTVRVLVAKYCLRLCYQCQSNSTLGAIPSLTTLANLAANTSYSLTTYFQSPVTKVLGSNRIALPELSNSLFFAYTLELDNAHVTAGISNWDSCFPARTDPFFLWSVWAWYGTKVQA